MRWCHAAGSWRSRCRGGPLALVVMLGRADSHVVEAGSRVVMGAAGHELVSVDVLDRWLLYRRRSTTLAWGVYRMRLVRGMSRSPTNSSSLSR